MAPIQSFKVTIFIIILFLANVALSIDVFVNGELHYFNTPISRYGHVEFNITGAGLAIADPVELCSEQKADYTNKIVITTYTGCSPLVKIRFAQERGAVGIIAHEVIEHGPTGNVYWKTADGRWAPNTSLPYVTINGPDGDTLRSLVSNTTLNDTLTADVAPFDHNEWINVLDKSNAYTGTVIALILANVAGLGFALSRLISLIMAKGCDRTTAHLTLSFICSLHITTIIYFVTNIIDIKLGPVAPDLFYSVFLLFPELFQMLSSLIVSLYWFELINSVTSKPIIFLKRLFKPFVAFSIIISVLYIVVIILSGLYLSDFVILLFLFIFLALSLTVAIIWIIVGAKLIHQIRTNAKLRENKQKNLNFNRLSTLIILCGIFLLLTRSMYLVLALDPTVYADPWHWLPIATLIYIFQLITALIQTGLFKLHKADFKSTSKGSDYSRNSHRASVHGSMQISSIVNNAEMVSDTMSEEQISGEETKRTASSAMSEVPKVSSIKSPNKNEVQEERKSSHSESEEKSSSEKQPSDSGSESEN